MTKAANIVVFDSGVGGLGIYTELCRLMPDLNYIYCLDNAYFPYGIKDDAQIIDRVCKLLPKIVDKYEATLLVVACNTASTIALEAIRKALSIPVVGVVPAIKVAARLTKTKVIGLLATEATVRRKYTEQLIADFATDCEIIKLGSRKLVDFAEAKVRGAIVDGPELAKELKLFFQNADLDTVVLACTHFDHLKDDFARVAPRPITWVSSAGAVALRTKTLVDDLSLTDSATPCKILVTTQIPEPSLLDALQKNYGFTTCETLVVH